MRSDSVHFSKATISNSPQSVRVMGLCMFIFIAIWFPFFRIA